MNSRESAGEDSDSSSLPCLVLGGESESGEPWRVGSKGTSWIKLLSAFFWLGLVWFGNFS